MLNGSHQERHKCISVAVPECNTGPVWCTSPVFCWALTVMEFVELDCVWNVMVHSLKPDFVFRRNGPVHLNRRGASVQSTTGSRGVRISGSNAGYTIFRGSVKSTGYPLHSSVSPSLPLPCVNMCHRISTGQYKWEKEWWKENNPNGIGSVLSEILSQKVPAVTEE